MFAGMTSGDMPTAGELKTKFVFLFSFGEI